MPKKLAAEKKTVSAMIEIYCKGSDHSRPESETCESCGSLLSYAHERLDRCLFGEDKPTCAQCPVHCYRPDERAAMTAVMRYSGPKMILRHPLHAIRHFVTAKKKPSEKVLQYLERRKRRASEENKMHPPLGRN